MINLDEIPNIERIELFRTIAEPIREYFHDPINVEKFNDWLKDNKI